MWTKQIDVKAGKMYWQPETFKDLSKLELSRNADHFDTLAHWCMAVMSWG